MVSALRRAGRVENGAVVAAPDSRAVVGVGGGAERTTGVEGEAVGTHVSGLGGSSGHAGHAGHAGKPRVPLRCRVPCWQDALPWSRSGSRMTAVAASRG